MRLNNQIQNLKMMERFQNRQKAIDLAIWRNFNYRYPSNFGVLQDAKRGDYEVIQKDASSINKNVFEEFHEDHSMMSYNHIQTIASDRDPLEHWEEILGMLSTMNGETLRFILFANVPLDKLIRHTIASRGFDENLNWVGFQKAEEIWLQ